MARASFVIRMRAGRSPARAASAAKAPMMIASFFTSRRRNIADARVFRRYDVRMSLKRISALLALLALLACTKKTPVMNDEKLFTGGVVAAGPQQTPQHGWAVLVRDGQAGVANTAALRAAKITRDTKDPEGGRIIRDASGNPTGVFVDAAQELIESKIPEPSFEVRKRRVLAAANRVAENGLTEMHDAGADGDTIRAVMQLVDEGKFPIRLYTMLTDEAKLLDAYFAKGPMIDHGGRFTVRSVKLYADGALGSRGALLLEPYSDDPGNSGLMVTKPDHMVQVARQARARGFQACTHAIGDRGVRNVIESYEAAGVTPADRFRIEHFQVVAPADFARTTHDGIIASMQPTHATSDMPWAEARVGPERIKGAYAWRTVLNSGARLALGSDFPVEDVNPFFGIYAAVTRQDQKGWPAGGWYPDQKLTLAEALRGFTLDAAYAAFEESSRGTIEAGKLADMTIVDGDFFAMPPSDLFKTKVRYTVVGGEIVYSAIK